MPCSQTASSERLQRRLGNPQRGDRVRPAHRVGVVWDGVQGAVARAGGGEEAERVGPNPGPDAGVQERGGGAAQDAPLQHPALHGAGVQAPPGHRHPVVRRTLPLPASPRQGDQVPHGPAHHDRQADRPGHGVSDCASSCLPPRWHSGGRRPGGARVICFLWLRVRLVGLVVKASASRMEDLEFKSCWQQDFSGSSHTSD